MAVMQQERAGARSFTGQRIRGRNRKSGAWRDTEVNVAPVERMVSVASGGILAMQGLSRGTPMGLLIAAVGGSLIYRGARGHCPAYQALGVDTAAGAWAGTGAERRLSRRGIHVEQSCVIQRSAEDLYGFWRDLKRLPEIMSHVERVRVIDERRSHWTAQAPRLAGGEVSWEAEIIADEPGQRIAWRSLPGSEVDTRGEVRFSAAPGERGTEVRVRMEYLPPAGRLGHAVAALLGESPRRTVREDLRRLMRVMETGETPTTAGQPQGSCMKPKQRERRMARMRDGR